ncbi:type III-B CRISPR-associated protein Cas10/Cmr2 [Desulfotomaculum copahuensis]|uniref:Type III-B CRISPR-associated protein Cas10/Cmr2 n=1 Tax=Desulfotomaculum copahuensis TaxID=1838280 RepID=A0A1B7LCJ9_9FIRM|nr:type III-B CRISPR-associated protein Cas10/Cmr2 [Desulfotomaculum copahuensis]OAT80442.1 type III-B CRISPR-associated protein Cas10/Cmr2 [Desulfotomaculum copahuensis]
MHFTLGPVQGFVAQARRTRDLYAGSFLLSYLAGQAMYAVIKDRGRIIFPDVYDEKDEVSDPILKAIKTMNEEKKIIAPVPKIGTLPNRFKAQVPGDFDPGLCRQAVLDSWRSIAAEVWKRYVSKVAEENGKGVKEIWDRQVEGFWEINWVIGEDNSLLDRRKNWRSHVPTVEAGDKCTVMGNLQELSGYIRTQKEQRKFWETLRKELPGLELRPDERLCAVALIKRLYPLVAKETIGWELPRYYPSTSYMAAVHWIARTIEQKPDWAEKFADRAGKMNREYGARFQCIAAAMDKQPRAAGLARLDGNCFYASTLENDRLWPEDNSVRREELRELLREYGEKPSPFYALLLMDGDQLGALLQADKESDGAQISRALLDFSKQVGENVQAHNGITIYAGGDDVLALLPLEDALAAAVALHNSYKAVFQNAAIEKATISGTIIYAHHHAPLKSVLAKLHDLLDKVAKDETGRDSLAVCVWKGAGPVLTWSAPWAALLEEPGCLEQTNQEQSNLIDQLVDAFVAGDNKTGEYNSSFFYNIRSRFEILADEKKDTDRASSRLTAGGEQGLLKKEEDIVKLLTAEYLKSRAREEGGLSTDMVEKRMRNLLRLCRRSWRENGSLLIAKGPLTVDGALLVRFLATKGVRD